jgi:hypothetical protein
VKLLQPITLDVALSRWGEHEKSGARRAEVAANWGEAVLELPGIAVTCLFRQPLVVAILRARPGFVHEVALTENDLPHVRQYTGNPIDDWRPENDLAAAHVDSLVRLERVDGPLICLVRTTDGTLDGLEGPVFVFDGLHRLAAWRKHLAMGRDYPMTAMLIGCRAL